MNALHSRRLSCGGIAGFVCMLLAASVQAAEPVRIVNEGGIRDEWMLADGAKLAAPAYPAAFAGYGDNVCLSLSYRINPDGTTSDFSMIRAWTNGNEKRRGYWEAFAQSAGVALAQWRFKPRAEVTSPKPVITVATMSFLGKGGEDPAQLRARCKVDDLAKTLHDLKVPSDIRDSLNGRQLEGAQRDAQWRMQQARGDSPPPPPPPPPPPAP